MKNTALAMAVIMFIMIIACPTVRFVAANPIHYPDEPSTELPTLIVSTPKNDSDHYADNTFKLDFIITHPESWEPYHWDFIPIIGYYRMHVYLDGNDTSTLLQSFQRNNIVDDHTAIFSNLTVTEHVAHIVVIANALYETINGKFVNSTYITQTVHFQLEPDSKTVSFQKDSQVVSRSPYSNPPIPIPIINSPENTSYTADNIVQFSLPLEFTINATASWIGYSLDNQSRITISGNCTLSELSVGSHNITLFVSGTFGNMGISNTTYFNIEPAPESFPTSLVMASSVTVTAVAIGLGLLVHFAKRK